MSRQAIRDRVRAICIALPEAKMEGDRHLGFSVRGRRFAWLVDDHHGDGRLAVHCKAASGENARLATADSERYFPPPYLGHRGWVGAWLDIPGIDWKRIEGLLVEAYRLTAPKRLAAQLDSGE